MWTHFSRGCRDYCGHKLSDDLKKDQKLPENIVTPTTKDDVHDELISAKEIVEQGIMSAEDWAYCEEKSLQLFRRGQEIAAKHGLLLVDTKYEFGKDAAGNIVLIDEIHTPDSSRYWLADTYEARVAEGKAPDSVDKDIVRRWIQQNCDPYKAKTLPTVPDSVIVQLSKAYIRLYELITGEKFQFADPEALSYSGLKSALSKTGLLPASKKVVIMMGSSTDMEFVESGLVANLRAMDLSYEVHVSSAHKTPIQAYNILQDYEKAKFENGRAVHQVVYITVAGRSNALSGFVSANCSFPTLACPPFKDKMDMMVNIHSTLQMPSSVPAMTVLEPSNCVLAAKRMLDFIEYPL
jgi:phosphoribosylaminoimidazole carboxylase PurE protein